MAIKLDHKRSVEKEGFFSHKFISYIHVVQNSTVDHCMQGFAITLLCCFYQWEFFKVCLK